ncbi:Spy/CpxP family protein refolding chaperone [Haloferula sp.]|uniref:Spy/CpxP family protein refolding chaperone n=1 Tax=Haloferula sp. TaxID=2497595 RepID=UPI003C768E60
MKPLLTLTGLVAFASTLALTAAPQVDPAEHAAHVAADPTAHQSTTDTQAGDPELTHDLAAMREKVAQLEAALPKKNAPSANSNEMAMPAPAQDAKMSGMTDSSPTMGKMDKMGMMKMGGGSMGTASATPSGGEMNMGGAGQGMGMMGDMGMMKMEGGSMGGMSGMGMMQMDKMKKAGMMGMGPMSGSMQNGLPGSALPGFPGASHLYHLGSTDFFLDHGSHILLTTEQTAALNRIKEQSALAGSASDRSIESAEEELWVLTSVDQPDIAAIEAKAEEIAKSMAEKRVAFIRSVGEAAKLLTDEQRQSLTGFAPPTPAMEGM